MGVGLAERARVSFSIETLDLQTPLERNLLFASESVIRQEIPCTAHGILQGRKKSEYASWRDLR